MEALDIGDGVSDIVRSNAELLAGLGQPGHILALHAEPAVQHLVRPLHEGLSGAALIFHFWGPHGATWLLDAARGPKAAYFHNITPPAYFSHDSDLRTSLQRGVQQLEACADRFDLVMAPSRFDISDFMSYTTSARPSIVVPPVVERRELRRQPYDIELVEAIQARRTTNIVFVGRMAPNKCQHLLVDLFDRYWTEINSNARLFLVGSTSDHGYTGLVRRRVERSAARDHVIITGHVPQVQLMSYFRAATVYVSRSEHEGFGIPLAQAMAFDTPVVALARAGIAETLGESGVLVDEWDDDRVVDLIDALAFDDELRRRVVDGQHSNLERFTADVAFARLAAAVRYLRERQPSPHIEWLEPAGLSTLSGMAFDR
jgi:glycosyltransferase involved in cell wall biosynthesis